VARTTATPRVQVAWTGQQTGVFRLDISLLDGTDVLAGSFGNNTFDAITADVKSCTITRGRHGDAGSIEQGRCVLRLKDSTGKYNPENAASPLAGSLDTHKPLRVQADHLGTTYGLFYGFVSRIEHDPDRKAQESTIEAVDFFEWLNAAKPTIASTGATTVGAAIGLILDALEWTDPSFRALDTGRSVPDFSADGTKSGLTLIQELLQVDLGFFFVDGAGIVTYLSSDTRWKARAVDDTFSGSLVSRGKPGVDKQRIVNRQTVTRTGGVAQTSSANDGKPYYDGSPISSGYLSSDTDALSLAQMIVALRKAGSPPVRELELWNRDDTAIAKQLGRELGDLVSFSESGGGTSLTGSIEGIAHEISSAGKLHKTTYLLTKRVLNAFTLDVSALDSTTDVLSY